MSKKQEGLFQEALNKIFEENKVTANEIGMDKALILADQQIKIFQLIEDAKADFPFIIYFDNSIGGENHYSFNIPGGEQLEDIDEITRGVADWLEKWFFGIKEEKKGLYQINRRIPKQQKKNKKMK
jgi:hypothetical protein